MKNLDLYVMIRCKNANFLDKQPHDKYPFVAYGLLNTCMSALPG